MNTHQHAPTPASPTVVRCESPADFLATLPVMLGYLPEDSVLLTLFEGSQAKSIARFDLPSPEVPLESTGLDRAMLELLEQHRWVSGVAIVVYCSDSFANQPGAPHALLAMWLERALEMHKTPVRELACVASDGWALYRSPEASNSGRPLTEIAHDSLMKREGLEHLPSPEKLHSLGSLPTPEPKLAELLRKTVEPLPTKTVKALTVTDMAVMLRHCHTALSDGFSSHSVSTSASLVQACASPETWFAPVLLIAAGGIGEQFIVDDELAETFLRFVQDPHKTTRPVAFNRLKLFSSERIDPSQLRETVHCLTELAAHTQEGLRPGVLALAAWSWWMGGMTTPALTLIHEAVAIDEHSQQTLLVQELCDSGPPLWAFSHDTR